MHRFRNASTPRAAGLALAGLVAVSTLGLSACAERDEAGTQPASTADGSAAQPAAAPQTAPAATPPSQAPAAGAAAGGALTDADRSFLAEALASNQHELQAAQLGLQKAEAEQVRAYAQRMQQDHSQLGTQMQPLVQQAGISMADPSPSMPQLETVSGEAFDQAFMEMMVVDHRKAVASFERAANDTAHSRQVRSTASQALPVLQDHLQQAESLARELGVELPAASPDAAAPAANGTQPPQPGDEGTGG